MILSAHIVPSPDHYHCCYYYIAIGEPVNPARECTIRATRIEASDRGDQPQHRRGNGLVNVGQRHRRDRVRIAGRRPWVGRSRVLRAARSSLNHFNGSERSSSPVRRASISPPTLWAAGRTDRPPPSVPTAFYARASFGLDGPSSRARAIISRRPPSRATDRRTVAPGTIP